MRGGAEGRVRDGRQCSCAVGLPRPRSIRVSLHPGERCRGNRRRESAGGKSGLRRARGQVTPGQRELEDSATERRTPVRTSVRRRTCRAHPSGRGAARQGAGNGQVSLKGCGKSAPVARATGSAWQTPSGATPNRTRAARPEVRVGGLSRPVTVGLEEWFPPGERQRTPGTELRLPVPLSHPWRPYGASGSASGSGSSRSIPKSWPTNSAT